MRKHQIALILLIAICTFLGSAGSRSLFLIVDFVIPGDEAAQFLASGKLPAKCGVSSLGSYIPPGVAWLEIPGFVLHRPLFSQIPAATALFILTLAGIYLIGKECAGIWTGLAAVALFGFSGNGMFWARSFWPHAYPVCYVWISLFTIWWVKKREPRYLFGALLVLFLGLSCHLELIFAVVPIAIAWFWLRPPIAAWPILAAVACSLIVWLPYFRFEESRHFVDLRSQLLVRTMPAIDRRAAFRGMTERYNPQTLVFEPFDEPPPPRTIPPWRFRSFVKNIMLAGSINFRESPLTLTMLAAIGLAFFACSRTAFRSDWVSWPNDRRLPATLLCLSLAIPWLLLSATAPPWQPARQWGLWGLQCLVACIGAPFLLSFRRRRWFGFLLIATWTIADALNVARAAALIARDGWAGAQCAEAKICDVVVNDSRGHPLRVGYFTVFPTLISTRPLDDPSQRIGVLFDRYFLWQYGLENQPLGMTGYSENDTYRIVENVPDGSQVYRFKPDLIHFSKIAHADGFELWKRDSK